MAGLNRDTTSTEKNLWNSDYSQNVDATLDHRILSDEGQKAIAEDVERTERLGAAIADVANNKAFELRDTLHHIDEVQKEVDVQKAFAQANKGKGIEAFRGDGTSVAEKQAAITTYATIYADTFGVSIEDATIVATDLFIGGTTYTENGTSSIAINDNTQKNALDYARTMGHEVTHARIHQKLTRDRENKDLNEEYADVMGDYAASGLEFSAYTYANIQLNANQTTNTRTRTAADKTVLTQNNEAWNADIRRAAAGLGEMDYRRLSVPEADLIEQARVKIQESPNLTLMERDIMEKQLEAVACATIRCADGVPTDSEKYGEMKGRQERGERLMAEGVTLDKLFTPDELEGKFEYTWVDSANDNLTSSGEALYRAEAGTQATLGVTGVVGGLSLGATGAAGCEVTLGASCLLVPVGATITTLSIEEGAQGFDKLFSPYVNSEGQAVADSFYLYTHPGEINPARDLAIDWAGLVLLPGAAVVAERYFLGSIDDVARSAGGPAERAMDDLQDASDVLHYEDNAIPAFSAVDDAESNEVLGSGVVLREKWGHLSARERQSLIQLKAEASAERWVRGYEDDLNLQYPELDAHFVDKHAPDIPLRPNLEQRSIDGTHPRSGQTPSKPKAQPSSQFQDWRTQRNVINEAITRESRGLPKYNAFDVQGNPAVVGSNSGGVGWGFTPNRLSPTTPTFNPQLNGWIIRFDSDIGVPFTGYPTK